MDAVCWGRSSVRLEFVVENLTFPFFSCTGADTGQEHGGSREDSSSF